MQVRWRVVRTLSSVDEAGRLGGQPWNQLSRPWVHGSYDMHTKVHVWYDKRYTVDACRCILYYIYVYTYIYILIYIYIYSYIQISIHIPVPRLQKPLNTLRFGCKKPFPEWPIISGESDMACPSPQLNHHNSWVHQDIYTVCIYIYIKINIMIEIIVLNHGYFTHDTVIHDKIR